MAERSKAQKIDLVHHRLLELIAERGIENVGIAELSRRAKVSRSWIYKFLGNNRGALIHQAALSFGRSFATQDVQTVQPRNKSELVALLREGSEKVFSDTARNPWIPIMYFRHWGLHDPIGLVIDQLEATYIRTLTGWLEKILSFKSAKANARARMLLQYRMALAYKWCRRPNVKSRALEESDEMLEAVLS